MAIAVGRDRRRRTRATSTSPTRTTAASSHLRHEARRPGLDRRAPATRPTSLTSLDTDALGQRLRRGAAPGRRCTSSAPTLEPVAELRAGLARPRGLPRAVRQRRDHRDGTGRAVGPAERRHARTIGPTRRHRAVATWASIVAGLARRGRRRDRGALHAHRPRRGHARDPGRRERPHAHAPHHRGAGRRDPFDSRSPPLDLAERRRGQRERVLRVTAASTLSGRTLGRRPRSRMGASGNAVLPARPVLLGNSPNPATADHADHVHAPGEHPGARLAPGVRLAGAPRPDLRTRVLPRPQRSGLGRHRRSRAKPSRAASTSTGSRSARRASPAAWRWSASRMETQEPWNERARPAARPARCCRSAAVLLAPAALGKPEIEDRWTRVDVVGANLTCRIRLWPRRDQPIVGARRAVTYRAILTGFAVAELRASTSVMPRRGRAPSRRRPRADGAGHRPAPRQLGLAGPRDARRHRLGSPDPAHRLRFDGFVPATMDSSAGPPGAGCSWSATSARATRSSCADGRTRWSSRRSRPRSTQILPVGMELGRRRAVDDREARSIGSTRALALAWRVAWVALGAWLLLAARRRSSRRSRPGASSAQLDRERRLGTLGRLRVGPTRPRGSLGLSRRRRRETGWAPGLLRMLAGRDRTQAGRAPARPEPTADRTLRATRWELVGPRPSSPAARASEFAASPGASGGSTWATTPTGSPSSAGRARSWSTSRRSTSGSRGGGVALERRCSARLGSWASRSTRRVFGLDTAHRDGNTIVERRESFGDWERAARARVAHLRRVKGMLAMNASHSQRTAAVCATVAAPSSSRWPARARVPVRSAGGAPTSARRLGDGQRRRRSAAPPSRSGDRRSRPGRLRRGARERRPASAPSARARCGSRAKPHNVVRTGPGDGFAIAGVFPRARASRSSPRAASGTTSASPTTETGWVHASLCKEFDDLSDLEFRPNPKLYSRTGSYVLVRLRRRLRVRPQVQLARRSAGGSATTSSIGSSSKAASPGRTSGARPRSSSRCSASRSRPRTSTCCSTT